MAKCAATKLDGDPCGANASRGTAYCIWHDPEVSDETKAEMRGRGGVAAGYKRRPPTNMPKIEVEEKEDSVIPVLQRAVATLEDMKVSPQALATLGSVASTLDRAIARQEARGADVTRIEVVYISDWRKG